MYYYNIPIPILIDYFIRSEASEMNNSSKQTIINSLFIETMQNIQ